MTVGESKRKVPYELMERAQVRALGIQYRYELGQVIEACKKDSEGHIRGVEGAVQVTINKVHAEVAEKDKAIL